MARRTTRLGEHMRKRLICSIAILATLAIFTVHGATALAGHARDYDIENGHYFEQGSSEAGRGFLVYDDDAAPLWTELQRLGGTQNIGYPISRRYDCDGSACQAFQQAIFKWLPNASEVELLNVYDWLHGAGKDEWLEEQWGVPTWKPKAPSSRKHRSGDEEAEQRAMIEANGAVKTAYDRPGLLAPTLYGAARAYRATDEQSVLRTQRAVLVQTADRPGQVHLAPAGVIFAEAGFVSPDALKPESAPVPLDDTPPTRIRAADLGIDAPVIPMDMGADNLLPVPDSGKVVAWYSYGARLGAEGNAVLAGHVDFNREPGAFWSLRDAQPGQTLTLISGTERAYDYRVDWAKRFAEDAPDGLLALGSTSGAATITLVTCTGRFDAQTRSYDDRYIVRATLVARRGLGETR